MAVAFDQSRANGFGGPCQKNENDAGATSVDNVPVRPLERRTGDDPVLPVIQPPVDPAGNFLQPRIPVLIRQRMSRGHLVDIGLGVQGIAFLEGPTQPTRKEGGNGGFAGPGDAHDDQYHRFGESRCHQVQRVHGAILAVPAPARHSKAQLIRWAGLRAVAH